MTVSEPKGFSTDQVARLVDLPAAQVRACARAGIGRWRARPEAERRATARGLVEPLDLAHQLVESTNRATVVAQLNRDTLPYLDLARVEALQVEVEANDLLVRPEQGDWQWPLQRVAFTAQLEQERRSWRVFGGSVRL